MTLRRSIIALLVSCTFLYAQPDFNVLSSGAGRLILEFTPVYLDTSLVEYPEGTFRNVSVQGGFVADELLVGEPAAESCVALIAVPSEYGSTIEVLDSRYNEIDGQLRPKMLYEKEQDIPAAAFPERAYETTERNLVTFGDYGISHGTGMQQLLFHPVQADPLTGKIRLYKRIRIAVSFPPSAAQGQAAPESFKGVVLNPSMAAAWNKKPAKNTPAKINATPSVLASGTWYRFEAPEEGIYRITYDMLPQYGIDPATVDPRTIKIYNNGGFVLPEQIDAPRASGLEENAIIVQGENDGKFDSGDYILFYGRGTNFFYYDDDANRYMRARNPYSDVNYFWITSGGAEGKRIQAQPSMNEAGAVTKTTSPAFVYWEEDKINIGKLGRHFLGDEFSTLTKSRSYLSNLDGVVTSQQVRLHYEFVNASQGSVEFTIEENGSQVLRKFLFGYGTGTYADYTYGRLDTGSVFYQADFPEERSVLQFTFDAQNSSSYGYIDFFEIFYQRSLGAVNDEIVFYSGEESGTVEYRLWNFSNSDIKVFNVTDHANVKHITNPVLHSGGEFRFQAEESVFDRSHYYALCGEDYKQPANPEQMDNQDLRGAAQGAEYIILTHSDFLSQAERLAQYRSSEATVPLTTYVVTVDKVFNEFSCGMTDPTAIRDFVKYAYDNWAITPEYFFIFGDGTYDYKNIEDANNNFVIPWETDTYLNEIDSFCSDDFYVWVDGPDTFVDLAHGRVHVQSPEEADAYIDKVIKYEQNSDRGSWRNLITLVADDALKSSGADPAQNTPQSERLANSYLPESYDQLKIYLTNYPTVQTTLGRRKPAVNEAIIQAVNNGTVLLNFIGHGSPQLWTHEQVFVQDVTIPQFVNDRYFFVTAATCDFGNYDKTDNQSATEELLVKPEAGAIGAFTSTRPVFSSFNAAMNQDFYANMLTDDRDTLNLPYPVGQAFWATKLKHTIDNAKKFGLFCDPGLRLAIPQLPASIDSINGRPADMQTQLKALSNVSVNGFVRSPEGGIDRNFNGEGILTVYDSEYKLHLPEIGVRDSMTVQGGVIFRGRVSINNGLFKADFVVPKDISYENKAGKIVFYFFNQQTDGVAFSNNVIIGGTDQNVTNDGQGPEIEIFFDDTEFSNALLARPNSKLIVNLNDATGLNTTGTGIGHKLEGVLNGDEANPIDFTNYFTGDLDSGGKSGQINYNFFDLATGDYTLEVKAWDVFNNPTTELTEFQVVSGEDLTVDYVMNYPNPFSSNTTFTFQQSLAQPIDVKIIIYTVAGRKIQELEERAVQEKFVTIEWDGRDRDGDLLANGTYLYKLIVKSIDGEFSKNVLGKLAVIR